MRLFLPFSEAIRLFLMKHTFSSLLVLILLTSACSLWQAEPDPPIPTETEPVAAEGDPERPNYSIEYVDGRKLAVETFASPSSSASPVLNYFDPGKPEDYRPAATKIEVSPWPIHDGNFVAQIPQGINTILFQDGRDGMLGGKLTRAMLRRDINLADRSELDIIQKELLLQGGYSNDTLANLKDSPFLGLLDPDLPGLDVATILARFQSPQPIGWLAPWWIWTNGQPERLVSGRDIDDQNRVTESRILPAEAFFKLLEDSTVGNILEIEYKQPAAEKIEYLPVILKDKLFALGANGTWELDSKDDFHFTCSNYGSFFDPLTGALWALDQAFIGREVTREEYLARRTTEVNEHCSSCQTVVSTDSLGPNPDLHPNNWLCRECSAGKTVLYYDGYVDARANTNFNKGEHAMVHWSFRDVKPGLYPILSPGNYSGLQHGPYFAQEVTWASDSLESRFSPSNLYKAGGELGWALVMEDGKAVLLAEKDRIKFAKVQGDTAFPAVTATGEQLYRLSQKPYYDATLNLPYSSVVATAEMVTTEESRMVLQGWIARNYFQVMPESVTIIANWEGPDLSLWPAAWTQEDAVRDNVADTIMNQF